MDYIRTFSEISAEDIALVGGKNASLGEMYNGLSKCNVKVPDGFAITSKAYWNVLEHAGILDELKQLILSINIEDVTNLQNNARMARNLIEKSKLPENLLEEIYTAYNFLVEKYGKNLSVAVRSSATAEDLPDASFAGQHDTFLNIKGEKSLVHAYKKCLASLFTDRAIVYRANNNYDHFRVALSVCVMKMVRSDNAASGVMFTVDTESGFDDVILINSTLGLGESIVQGLVNPDEFYVHKPTFARGYRAVLKKNLGTKKKKIMYGEGDNDILQISTSEYERGNFSIADEDIFKLAEYAIYTEKYYSQNSEKTMPMDIEWAKDSVDDQIYLIQARPETVISQKNPNIFKQYRLKEHGNVVAVGRAAGSTIAHGKARIIESTDQLTEFIPGEVLIADITSPDWSAVLKKASAVVTNRGGRTCHAAIVARELGIPAVVGTQDGTEKINNGDMVTVSCAEGNLGKVYAGVLEVEVIEVDLRDFNHTNTKLMINLGDPDQAFKYSSLPCDGVGLARMEFIINKSIGVHPMALLHKEKLKDKSTINKIEHIVKNYLTPKDYFIEKLAEGVGIIAAAFYPRQVIVRMSDFKSNEYANLLGGRDFEPKENNPMLGLRGASRYSHPIYEKAFRLECQAMKYLREDAGFENIALMIPFCRNLKEAASVINLMQECNLVSGDHGLKIYVMCEIPNNVVLIDKFLELFDGISIGSNDLTQLVLGVDRDSEIVAFDFDERDPGVLEMIRLAVEGTKRNNKYSGICGQAPSDYPEMAQYLIEIGIDSISVSPDKLLQLKTAVADLEQKLH